MNLIRLLANHKARVEKLLYDVDGETRARVLEEIDGLGQDIFRRADLLANRVAMTLDPPETLRRGN